MGYKKEKDTLLNSIKYGVKPDETTLAKSYQAYEVIEAIEDIWRRYFIDEVATAADYMIEIREVLQKF